MLRIETLILFFALLVSASFANAGDTQQALTELQQQWAKVNYDLTGEKQLKAFESLLASANRAVEANPESAELLIWRGIINSTYAGAKGGLGALKYVNASREDLEQALALNTNALQGSAYTSLGTLYFKVPGWPIAFGDDDKAEELLKKALTINPDGIDPNYFFAQFLIEEGKYTNAEYYLQRALKAAPRPGRERADQGRREEIMAALNEVKPELK